MSLRERLMSEEATGIAQRGASLGKVYADGGAELKTKKQIRETALHGGTIEIPNAGAGSYREVFVDLLQCSELKTMDTCSSAGDWTFGVKHGHCWYPAFQNNRYPRYGFRYSIDWSQPTPSFEKLCENCFA